MRHGWKLPSLLPGRVRPGLFLLFIGGLLAACNPASLRPENLALAELKTLDAAAARKPTFGEYEVALKNAEPRVRTHLVGVEPMLRLEFERALAWYKLADFLWENNQTADGRGPPECLAEAKRQTDWLERYLASGKFAKKRLMAEKETARWTGTGGRKTLEPSGFKSPLNVGGEPEPFFSRQPPRATPIPPRVAPDQTSPVTTKSSAVVILTGPMEVNLPFGKVKLQPGLRLHVLGSDGKTITAKYGNDRIAVPVALTRPAS